MVSIKIYTAQNILEAQMIADLLTANQINHLIKNSQIQAALGEIPVFECLPTIWVAKEKSAEALELINEFKNKNTIGTVWKCSCGEVSEPQFTHCWHCGKSRP